MVGKVLFAVDGSLPPSDAAALARGLLPKADEVLVLQVVPQLPYAWNTWPAFPDLTQDLARAWAYVSEVADGLEAQDCDVGTRVYCSPLSAAEVDQEILKLADSLRPNLIFLALARGRITANIVSKAVMPVLVAKPSACGNDTRGLSERLRELTRKRHLEPGLVHRTLLLNPAAALIFRHAGIV